MIKEEAEGKEVEGGGLKTEETGKRRQTRKEAEGEGAKGRRVVREEGRWRV